MTVRHAPSSFFQAIPMIDFQAPCVFPVASNPRELPKGSDGDEASFSAVSDVGVIGRRHWLVFHT